LHGELFISGSGLARGYLGHPELTANHFLPHPFSSSPGARLYRTGDIARLLPDGSLEFLGRNDHQIKICGHRIEMSEIEDCLERLAGIRQAAVLLQEDRPRDQRLIAYLHPAEEAEYLDEQQMRSWLQQQLPAYMIPGQFFWLERFSLAPNGRLDRQDRRSRSAALPGTVLERTIASVWCAELGVERIDVHENVLELGVHSLLLARVHARLQKRLQREIPIGDLLGHPTVHDLARHLSEPQEKATPLWSNTHMQRETTRRRPGGLPDK
jgi:acyl carrier protein